MTAEDEIVQRLDKVIAILQLAHGDAIEESRLKIRSDTTYRAILDATRQWAGAARVQAAATKAGAARSTTSRKIAELIELGMLEKKGGGKAIEYRSTGLI